MTFLFGDGFDYYTTATDAGTFWDLGQSFAITTGRFIGRQALGVGALAAPATVLSKSSGLNDQTHHIVVAFQQTALISGTTAGMTLTLLDGATAQCSIVFQSSGNILLTSGVGTGTMLATYSSAFSQNVWAGFEFEITIDNTAGVFRVRKNGNSVNDFQATNLNTRGGTTNSYANKLQVVYTTNASPLNGSATAQLIDDLLWFNTTGTAPNTWVGDVRTYQLLPISDVSTQFSRSVGTPYTQTPYTASTTGGIGAGAARYAQFTPTYDGTMSTVILALATGNSGNMKCTIFANASSAPGAILVSATPISNPVTGNNTFTLSSPLTVTKGTTYWIGFDCDTTSGLWDLASGSVGAISTTPYASFPLASPAVSGNQSPLVFSVPIVVAGNYTMVYETQEDTTTDYVSSSTVGQADFYTCASLPGTPASIIAVTTRGYGQKSDAGTRIGQVQMKSGSTVVQSGAVGLANSFTWQWRTDITDPNTGQSWTASGVNNLQIGPTVGG